MELKKQVAELAFFSLRLLYIANPGRVDFDELPRKAEEAWG